MMSRWGQAELERRLSTIVKIGTVAAVDHASGRVRVSAGGITTAWLPWPVDVGRNYRRWRPMREGQQVVLVAPSGDLAQAAVAGMLYSNDLAAPDSNPDLDVVVFEDGTRIEYDSSSGKLTIDCVGDVDVRTPSRVTIDSPETEILGDLDVLGNISVTGGDVTADGISLKNHIHTGDSGSDTSPPKP